MLEVVLARAASLAAGEGALVVALAGVDTGVVGEVTTGGEATPALGANVFFLGRSACGGCVRARRRARAGGVHSCYSLQFGSELHKFEVRKERSGG